MPTNKLLIAKHRCSPLAISAQPARLTLTTGWFALLLLPPVHCVGIDSSWTGPSGSWQDASNWTSGVPEAAGDVANLVATGRSSVAISVDGPVTVGQLDVFGTRTFFLQGLGPLTFDQPGQEPARLLVTTPGRDHVISVPLGIADDEQLIVDILELAGLELAGGIGPGAGDLVQAGNGKLVLSGVSPNWDGALTIDGGEATVRDAGALGTAVGGTRVNDGGTLRLIENIVLTDERIVLDGGTLLGQGTSSGNRYPLLSNDIELLSSGRMQTHNTSDRITYDGQIVGAGDLAFGRGFHLLLSENSYTGLTTIGPGGVDVRHERGLGSPVQGTIVLEGGSLVLFESSPEPITLRGGLLRLRDNATSTGLLTLESGYLALPRDATFPTPIVVANSGDNPYIQGDRITLTGGVSGAGDLLLRGTLAIDQQGLSHDGGLNADGGNSSDSIVLNTANSYTGPTQVLSGQLVVNNPQALGSSDLAVEVAPNGRLVLNAPTSLPLNIAGLLEIADPQLEFSQTIVLKPSFQSGLSSAILGVGTFHGEIHLDDEILSDAFLLGGTYNGVVSGRARRLNLGGDEMVSLNATNTYQGISTVRRDAAVDANTPLALGSPEQGAQVNDGVLNLNAVVEDPIVVIGNGRVNINVQQSRLPRLFTSDVSRPTRLQTVAVQTPSQYDEDVEVNEGRLEINADTTLRSATILNQGEIRVAEGKTLQINASELVLHSGSVDGLVVGPQTIRKITLGPAPFRNLADFDGELVIEGGITRIETDAALGSPLGATRVAAERNAAFYTLGSMTIDDDLRLENATGIDAQGGLFIDRLCCSTPTVQLRGDLDLGDRGSIIGSGDSESTGDTGILQVFGRVTGGDLITAGRRLRMELFHRNNSYTGKTDLRSGSLELARNGRLRTTSEIVLHEAPEHFDGTLLLNNSLASVPDRILDAIPITFRGGELLATGGTTETLGVMNFVEGSSSIDLTVSYNSNEDYRELTAAALLRETGATAAIDVAPLARLFVTQPPVTSGGILPWLTVTTHRSSSNRTIGFGQITEEGVVGLEDYQTDINQSTASDHVLIGGSARLNSDATVQSLTFGDRRNLDLAGNLLVVESGGLLMNGSTISGGQVTAGPSGGYELIVHHGQIEADITDHPNGSVAVTTTRGTTFSGNNSYSGGTYVNEQTLDLATETALPEGTDLQIVGGEVHIGYQATAPKHLGNVRIAGDGALQGGQGIFSFDQLVLEEGDVLAGQLVGDGEVFKETLGNAVIAADARSTYSGTVAVNQGRLDVSGLSQAVFEVNGGKLVVPVGENSITLAGGELGFNTLTGVVEILEPSKWIVSEADFEGTLVGSANLTIATDPAYAANSASASSAGVDLVAENPDFSGDVHIDGTRVDLWKEQSLGTGEIYVHAGGRLRLAPRQGNFEGAKLDLLNTVHLWGGEIRGFDSVFRPQQLLGDLFVEGPSFIRDMNVVGTMHLADGSRLAASGEGVMQLLGEVRVGGDVEFEYGLTQIGVNAAGINVGVVQILGTVASDAEHAVLNLVDRGLDEIVLDASYLVAAGQTLEVRAGGQPLDLTLRGAGKSIAGGGRLLNPVSLAEGAVIRPGSSPGVMEMGAAVTMGPGAIYQWEINDALGAPGASSGWDLLTVAGELAFTAAEELPFILEVVGLDATGAEGAIENFDPFENYQWLIASAQTIVGWEASAVEIDVSSFAANTPAGSNRRWSLAVDEGNLWLTYEIPEPQTSLLLGLALAIGTLRRTAE